MTRFARRLFLVTLVLSPAACGRGDDGGHDIRRQIRITSTDEGPRVSVYGLTPGMDYASAAERAGGDTIGAFFGAEGPITTFGRPADFGTQVGMLANVEEGRVRDLLFVFRGERRALERLEARVGEALASLPRGPPERGRTTWTATERRVVWLRWGGERGREELALRVVELGGS